MVVAEQFANQALRLANDLASCKTRHRRMIQFQIASEVLLQGPGYKLAKVLQDQGAVVAQVAVRGRTSAYFRGNNG